MNSRVTTTHSTFAPRTDNINFKIKMPRKIKGYGLSVQERFEARSKDGIRCNKIALFSELGPEWESMPQWAKDQYKLGAKRLRTEEIEEPAAPAVARPAYQPWAKRVSAYALFVRDQLADM